MPAMAPAGIVWLYPAWLIWLEFMLPAGAVCDMLEAPIEGIAEDMPIESFGGALTVFAQTVLCLLMASGGRAVGFFRRRLSSGLTSGSG